MRDGRSDPTRMTNGTRGATPRRTRSQPAITSFASKASSPIRVATSGSSIRLRQPRQPSCKAAPKLVRIDLRTNRVAQVIPFDETVAPQGSYLNDVRFSPDGRHAYLTDAGAKGALVVVDLQDGKARRVLDGHPSTQPEKDAVVKIDGRELRRPDGRGVEFAADSIALSPDGRTLYWKALTGRTLYRIPTDTLNNSRSSEKEVEARVERVGQTEPTDGLWIDGRGRLYLSAIEQDAVKVRDGDRTTTLVQDKRLRWPDTVSEGPDGTDLRHQLADPGHELVQARKWPTP